MIRGVERLAIDLLCALALLVVFAASAMTMAPSVVRWSAIAGGVSVALMVFPLVLERGTRGVDLLESDGPMLPAKPTSSPVLRILGGVIMLLTAVAQAVGMAVLFMLAAVLVTGGTPQPSRGLYFGVGVAFLLGFIAQFSFLKPRWS